jgi:hypothetical protein
MSDKKLTINTDDIILYFKNLTTDMIIAYAILAVGIAALIIGLVL